MDTQWVASSVGLPHEGELVEFLLQDREVAMDGTYIHQTFRSRWTDYDVERVWIWRSANALAFTYDACVVGMATGGARCAA
jgi:hypothetical protein